MVHYNTTNISSARAPAGKFTRTRTFDRPSAPKITYADSRRREVFDCTRALFVLQYYCNAYASGLKTYLQLHIINMYICIACDNNMIIILSWLYLFDRILYCVLDACREFVIKNNCACGSIILLFAPQIIEIQIRFKYNILLYNTI